MEFDDQMMDEIVSEVKAIGTNVAKFGADFDARLTELEKKFGRSKITGAGGNRGDAVAEHKALAAFARRGDESEIKAMSVGSDPDGGYFVMPVMAQTMIKKLFDSTPMRQLARVEMIGTGGEWEEPIDGSDIGASWVGETEGRPETDTPQGGMLKVPLHEIEALQNVTQRLLDDSFIDIGAWLEGKINDKFTRSEGTAFVTGSGFKQPRGFLTRNIVSTSDATRKWGDLQYIAGGDDSSVTADGLRSLVWGLRAPYRAGANWLMNSNTAGSIDKLKNGAGDYLWRNGMTAGAPDSLLGYEVQISEDMPDVTGGATPIAFGNFQLGYLIVDRQGIKMLRDPFTSKPNVLFYAYRRVGGDVANSEAIKVMKITAS